MHFETTIDISFGDCDPAEIVYYPNYFSWFDAAFHGFLKSHGLDHAILRERLQTAGTGLFEAGASFRAPARYGDRLEIAAEVAEWRDKSVRLSYRGQVGERLVVEGFEVRGLFRHDGRRLRAAPVAPLRELLEKAGG